MKNISTYLKWAGTEVSEIRKAGTSPSKNFSLTKTSKFILYVFLIHYKI